MLNIHHDKSRLSRVRVAFENGALSFMLPKDATFEDLADRLDRLGERHHGKPVAIEVKVAATSDAQRRQLISELGRGIGYRRIAHTEGTPDPNIGVRFPQFGNEKRKDYITNMSLGSQVLMTVRPRLRGLGLVLTIFAVLAAGMLGSACGTVAGAGQDKAGNMRAWLQY